MLHVGAFQVSGANPQPCTSRRWAGSADQAYCSGWVRRWPIAADARTIATSAPSMIRCAG